MSIDIRPIHPVIGGEVAGIDIRKPLSPKDVAAIDAAIEVGVGIAAAGFPGREEGVDVTAVDATILVEVCGAGKAGTDGQ